MVENSTNSGKEKTDNSPESKGKTFLQKIYEFFFYFSVLQKGLRIYIAENYQLEHFYPKFYDWILFFDSFWM